MTGSLVFSQSLSAVSANSAVHLSAKGRRYHATWGTSLSLLHSSVISPSVDPDQMHMLVQQQAQEWLSITYNLTSSARLYSDEECFYAKQYIVGMILDEQLDQEMHTATPEASPNFRRGQVYILRQLDWHLVCCSGFRTLLVIATQYILHMSCDKHSERIFIFQTHGRVHSGSRVVVC
ncbi:hypothetical protein BDR03DRAFT_998278 [Suillus americanus]|nr:hypothetical protein BDR03DRAFT_998278 [Suillus americanus]